MKVKELLTNINNREFNLEEALEVKKYLPIEVKKTIAQAIMYECANNDGGALKIDSVQRYLAYVRYMITMHTNLEYMDEDYDVLRSTEYGNTNLLNSIMECFKDDAKECDEILGFIVDDYKYEMSVEYSIAKLVNGLQTLVGGLSEKFDSLDLQSMIPDGISMDKLKTFLKNYIK